MHLLCAIIVTYIHCQEPATRSATLVKLSTRLSARSTSSKLSEKTQLKAGRSLLLIFMFVSCFGLLTFAPRLRVALHTVQPLLDRKRAQGWAPPPAALHHNDKQLPRATERCPFNRLLSPESSDLRKKTAQG